MIRFRSPLLTEYPFLQVLRCFTSLRTPHQTVVPPHNGQWVPPFGNPRINALSTTPRGLSQPHTSFIGPVCQGIHHTPLLKHPQTRKHPSKANKHQTTQKTQDQTIKRKNTVQTKFALASTIQLSNHQPHTTKPHRTPAMKPSRMSTPKPVTVREPKSMPTPLISDFFHTSKPHHKH